LLESTACPKGLLETCIEGKTPDPAWNGACVPAASDSIGDTAFCCDTSKPMCLPVAGCPDPAQGYFCHELSAPPIPGESIQCGLGFSNDAGTFYCCASGDVCFAAPASTVNEYCAATEQEHFCTGSATPSDRACHPAAAGDGGSAPSQARAFCCPGGDADAGADAGPDADSASDAVGDAANEALD
jgi:hypothetical protein